MPEIHIENRSIAVPGERIATGMDILPGIGTYRNGDDILASRLGLVNIDARTVRIIPLSGPYIPKKGDTIICKVVDVSMHGWRLETNCAYNAMMHLKDATSDFVARGADLTQYYNIGDWVVCKITNVTSQKQIDVAMKGPGLRKLKPARIITVDANKVPRIIGKQASMVKMIKDTIGCQITVGQNGIVWIDGEPDQEIKAINAIRKIEKESHISGLTDKIKQFLEEQSGGE